MRRWIANLVKLAVSVGLVAYLVSASGQDAALHNLQDQPKHWGLLSLTVLFCLAALLFSLVRWYLLAKALDIPITLRQAIRLGFIGYVATFVTLGMAGGDALKAVLLCRDNPRMKVPAVVSVFVDRVFGLYMVFLLAGVAIVFTGQLHSDVREIQILSQGTLLATLLATLLIGTVLAWPRGSMVPLATWFEQIPRVGPLAFRFVQVLRSYRTKPGVLFTASLLSLANHALGTLGVYCVALGLPDTSPTLAEHFVIFPIAVTTSLLPLPLNGLGAFEGVFDFLYRSIDPLLEIGRGRGFLVAIGYRLGTLAVAVFGACYYVMSWRDVRRCTISSPLPLQAADSQAA